jgi:hypothetical protein
MQEKVTSALRNTILPHQRNYAHTFVGDGRSLSEKDYTQDELNALRQAIVNHEYTINNTPDLDKKIQVVRDYIARENKQKTTPLLSRYKERVIDYPDYKQVYSIGEYGEGDPINFNSKITRDQWQRLKNTKDPNYFMQGTIGAADYSIDKDGNVVLIDRYDFTQDKIGDAHYSVPAMVAKAFGKPYDIKINLGNINDWGMKYSGYNNMIEQANHILNSPQYQLQKQLEAKGVSYY